MIPKIIHYCWFGRNPKPKNIEKYISGWKEKLPGYEFKEWNEDNFDIENSIPYVKQAYEAKKYAFVSDYVRLFALYQYGGVYFDTDIEVVKDFSELIAGKNLVLGYENKNNLCTAFIASEKHNELIGEFLNSYNERKFINDDGTYDLKTINQGLTEIITEKGIHVEERNHLENCGITFYTSDYFSGQDVDHGHPYITENTYTIHQFVGSWHGKLDKKTKVKFFFKYKLIRPLLQKIFGYEKADKLIDRSKRK